MPKEIDPADLVTLRRLEGGLNYERPELERLDKHYEGEQPLRYMAPALREEIGEQVTELVINWGRTVADAYESRLDIDGFRFPTADSGDQNLSDIWQANDMDEQSQMGHLDSVVMRRSYVIVGAGETDGPPRITVESPLQVWAERDPRNRAVSNAVKSWAEIDGTQRRALMAPGYNVEYALERGRWVETFRDDHDIGRVSVVPLVNRPRTLRPNGTSELVDVLPLADAANKMATDMMVSGEFHAMPRRWAFGMKASDFQDKNGNPISTWSKIAGRLWANENPEVKVGTFPESDLAVFHNTIKLLAMLVAHLAALPPHYMGFGGDNPASADAIRSSESQLVKRVERKHTFLGGGWEEVQRMVLRFQTGAFDPRAEALETVWRDPSTPTEAQKADAVVKKRQSGIITLRQAREDLGYSRTQIERMEQDEANESDPFIAGITRSLSAAGDPASNR